MTSPAVTSALWCDAVGLAEACLSSLSLGQLASHTQVRHSRTFYIMLASTYEEAPRLCVWATVGPLCVGATVSDPCLCA